MAKQPDASAAPTPTGASLLAGPPAVINVGLERFAEDLAACGARVTHVAWSPPARGNPRLAALLAKLGT